MDFDPSSDMEPTHTCIKSHIMDFLICTFTMSVQTVAPCTRLLNCGFVMRLIAEPLNYFLQFNRSVIRV